MGHRSTRPRGRQRRALLEVIREVLLWAEVRALASAVPAALVASLGALPSGLEDLLAEVVDPYAPLLGRRSRPCYLGGGGGVLPTFNPLRENPQLEPRGM